MLTYSEKTELEKLLKLKETSDIKNDAWLFCLYYLPELYEEREHLQPVAYLIQWIIQKELTPDHIKQSVINDKYTVHYSGAEIIKRASISEPPRSGKSITCSLSLAWALGHYPKECIMRNACTAALYRKFSYDTRDIIRNPLYQKIFPDIKLSPDKQNVDGWDLTTSKQGAYFGGGVGGTIIGFGSSLIAVTDDLYSGIDDALSDIVNEKIHRWKDWTHGSRLEKNCPQLDIGTRWTKKDVIGKGIEDDKYDIIIKIPALDENDKSFCEDVKTTEEYLGIRNDVDESLWDAEYQQDPIELKGLVFPIKKLKRFKLSDLNDAINYNRTSAIDTADGGTDYYSHIDSFEALSKYYIVDVIFNKLILSQNQPITQSHFETHNIENCVLEINKEGSSYKNNLTDDNPNVNIYAKWNTTKKITRILVQAGWILEHCYFRTDYEKGSDYDKFIKNLTSFVKEGSNKNDDAPDSMALLAWYIRNIL